MEKFGMICRGALLSGLGVLSAAPALAQTQDKQVPQSDSALGEIVVTAERRTESVQKTATAVSVRSGSDLLAEGKYSLSSIIEDIPGMGAFSPPLFAGGTDNVAAGLNIRGIPSNLGVGGSSTSVPSSAAMYVDGIYEGTGGSYDIDRVEVLRGPQGTLYGRSATSGVVAIHTRDPKLGEYDGNLSAELGNYNLRHYSGAINLPIGDKIALRVSGDRYLRDGFDASRDVTYGNTKDLRMKLLAEVTDRLTVLVGAAGQDAVISGSDVNTYLTSPNSYRLEYEFMGQDVPASPGKNKTRQFWAEINWDMGFGTLTYQPAFRNWKTESLTLVRAPIFSFDKQISTPKDEFMTHELRLASSQDSKLKWQVGTLFYDNSLHTITTDVNMPAGSLRSKNDTQRDTTAWGVFAEATYPVTDSLRITGGLRYDRTKVAVNQTLTVNQTEPTIFDFLTPTAGYPEVLVTQSLSGSAGKKVFTAGTYKARIEYDLTPQNMIYAMTSSAVSPGDVSLTTDINEEIVTRTLKSYIIRAYEIGSKNRFMGNQLQVNASAYYNDYGGYQALNVNVNPVPPPFSPSVFDVLVAPVKVVGAELEVRYKPTTNDIIGLDLAYTHSWFSDRSQVTSTGATFETYFGLSEVPRVVPFTAQVSYDHFFELGSGTRLSLGGDVRYQSSYYTDRILKSQLDDPVLKAALLPYVKAEAYALVNLHGSLSFGDGKYALSGWVRNVGGHRYKTSANVTNVTAANLNTPGMGLNAIDGTVSAPRTWGVSLSARF